MHLGNSKTKWISLMSFPIKVIAGLELDLPEGKLIAFARVLDAAAKFDLSWDRFVRLKAAAEAVCKVVEPPARLLDVGGYDGALALFLPEY
jgi:hypothetical protein